MLYLLLSIACSVLLGFAFKLFDRFRVHTFQAIMFNYFTCLACGWLQSGQLPYSEADRAEPWMPFALLLGLVFVSGFNTAAQTVRH
ncbi:MAG: EamA/RhaT family transporter, partial [Saprospiraceae bacterium]